MGFNTYEYTDLLSELNDNAIAAKRDDRSARTLVVNHLKPIVDFRVLNYTRTFVKKRAHLKTYTQFLATTGGINGFSGMPSKPIETYSFNVTQSNGNKAVYDMTLWNLTWTVNFATSTDWMESDGPYMMSYQDRLVNTEIALNSAAGYISGSPSNVYFGIAAIALQNKTDLSQNSNCLVQTMPSSNKDLLSITSPTNGENPSDAFARALGVGLIVLIVFFPEHPKALSHAVSSSINKHTDKSSGKSGYA